ncbi:MAG: tRNA pseudouridine(13) synthase TruD [Candidatus Thermoplasmatota archaeon]|jgi:tRNA pseudouridine13 synthase|nr:tRNA pseudouridine(13) synthase TruD [Candidatus Thermoplasmatota archaeon]
MKVLDAEKFIGIEAFLTPFKGIGGKLRVQPEDFLVEEISSYPSRSETGKYLIASVTSKNWETNHLIRELSDYLRISRQRIGFAGTKDKRAKTTQLMSFYNVPAEKLLKIKIKNVSFENIYRSDKPVKLGDLLGNKFDIIIRNIKKNIDFEHVKKIASFINEYGGFPNFFGIQRFGIIRPNTHIVGKYIVKGDFEKAVMSYIANPMETEDEETYNLRKNLQETHDFAYALKSYPNKLIFEKAVLNKLVINPDDFVAALKELPKNLLTMFVYAYQSYLFNRILSQRIKKKIPLNEAVVGDIVLPIRKGVVDETGIKVTKDNIKKVNLQISKGKAVVSGILIGSDSIFSEGVMGEIEHKIIESEKLDPRDFIIPDIPFISSAGSRRALLASVKNLESNLIDDDLNKNKKALNMKFDLSKGCYATSLIREFMKAEDIRNY